MLQVATMVMAPLDKTESHADEAAVEKTVDPSADGDAAKLEPGHGTPLEKTKSRASAKVAAAKSYVLFAAIFLSTFLMALNGSIVSTVSGMDPLTLVFN
jgi:hypothetical protein